jgi:long-chain acyl-CoA synthetase
MLSRDFAKGTPDKPAYIMPNIGEVVTYKQLEERANRCAHMFRDMGLNTGDNIAVLMENNSHYLEVISAAARSGLYFTPVSTHLKKAEIEYILNDCGAKGFVTSYAKRELVAELTGDIPNLRSRLMVGGTIQGYESFEEKVANYPVTPIPDEAPGQDMLYSSGTTGRPKGIKRNEVPPPLGELAEGALLFINLYGFDKETVYISPAPLYHAAPLRFCLVVLAVGGTVVVMDRFDSLKALQLIEEYKITHGQWVPTMFIRMLKLPEEDRTRFDVSSMKVAVHAAAPIPILVKEKMIQWWGPILNEYYAGTEGHGITVINSEEWMKRKGSVGFSLKGEIHILDEEENELPPREPGIIYISDGFEFEYHNDPEKTTSSRSSKGWSTIGDIGYLDEDGYLYLTDRKDNVIISGGVNIYPQESENVLVNHSKVIDVAVLGVPNEEFGEEVKAVVELKDMADGTPELARELIAFCQKHLSKIKCPVSVDFVDELPRTPEGKLLKRLLKNRYWEGK